MGKYKLVLGISIVTTALLSSAVSMFFFKHYFEPDPIVVYEKTNEVNPLLASYNYSAKAINTRPSALPAENFVATSKKVTNSVVNITSYAGRYRASSGSGVIISRDGYIVTNYHVVEGGDEFTVTLSNKQELLAEVIGTDPTTDLALVKVKSTDLTAVKFGDSDEVEVGQWVLAVGNPFNLTSTVTAGIVSAKGRNIDIIEGTYGIESFIQTDAVVNPGNSGGALVNASGELIGINTAILSETGGYAGYSFAIPSNLARKVITDLRSYGEVKRALLGVSIRDLSTGAAEELGLSSLDGVYINDITPDGSADYAGLREGDVIVAVNSIPVKSTPELQEQVARYRPGDIVSVTYIRKGKRYKKENIQLKGIDARYTQEGR